jgi:hypothetical protein
MDPLFRRRFVTSFIDLGASSRRPQSQILAAYGWFRRFSCVFKPPILISGPSPFDLRQILFPSDHPPHPPPSPLPVSTYSTRSFVALLFFFFSENQHASPALFLTTQPRVSHHSFRRPAITLSQIPFKSFIRPRPSRLFLDLLPPHPHFINQPLETRRVSRCCR